MHIQSVFPSAEARDRVNSDSYVAVVQWLLAIILVSKRKKRLAVVAVVVRGGYDLQMKEFITYKFC